VTRGAPLLALASCLWVAAPAAAQAPSLGVARELGDPTGGDEPDDDDEDEPEAEE